MNAPPSESAPFAVQRVVDSPYFTNREVETRRVLEAMRGAGRLVLYGERRQGKTSVIRRAAQRVRDEGGVVLEADAWTVDSLDALTRALLASVPASWLVGERVGRLIRTLRGALVLTADAQGRPQLALAGSGMADPHPDERFRAVLEGLDGIAAGGDTPVGVVIDEFQHLDALHPRAVPMLRSVVQDTPNLAWLFAGSVVGAVEEMIGPQGPFHAIERLEVKGIDEDHLVEWMRHRFGTHGVEAAADTVRTLYERAGPVTEYVLRLANRVHRRARPRGRAEPDDVDVAFDEIVAEQESSYGIIWDKMSRTKRLVLQAVARGEQHLASREVLDRYGISGASAAGYAVGELRSDAVLAPGKPYRISDPFLAAWIRMVTRAPTRAG